MFSCNVGAKLSFDQTLIPTAVKAGAKVRDLCEVQAVKRVPDGYEVRVLEGPRRRAAVCATGGSGGGNAQHVEDTAALDGRRNLGAIPRLGKRFSLAGDWVALYDRVPRNVTRGGRHRTHSGRPDAGTRMPGTDSSHAQIALRHQSPIIGGSRLLPRASGSSYRSSPRVRTGSMDGQVTWKGRGVVVEARAGQAVVSRIQASHRPHRPRASAGRKLHLRRPIPRSVSARGSAFHPMVGLCMATDSSRGVVDFQGRGFGHPGLYVADTSVLPTMTIAGPQLSVSALRIVDRRAVDEDAAWRRGL